MLALVAIPSECFNMPTKYTVFVDFDHYRYLMDKGLVAAEISKIVINRWGCLGSCSEQWSCSRAQGDDICKSVFRILVQSHCSFVLLIL